MSDNKPSLSEFEIFTRLRARGSPRPRVSIQKRGWFSLNGAAMRALGSPSRVMFMHNAATGAIAIAPAPEVAAYAVPLRHQKGADTWLAAATAFLRQIEYNHDDVLEWVNPPLVDGALMLRREDAIHLPDRRRHGRTR